MNIGNAQNARILTQNAHPCILSAGAYFADAGVNFSLHQHTYWELVYHRRGRIRGSVGAHWYEIEPGVLLATPPETPHCEIARTAYANFYMAIDAPQNHPWPVFTLDVSGDIGRIFEAIVRETSSNQLDRTLMLELLIGQLDVAIRRAHVRQRLPDSERLVEQAERIMEERFSSQLQIQDVAREIGASPSVLRRQFARVRQKSPMDHLLEVRVRHAMELLRSSTLTLEAIATLSGFHSASHLSRYVKYATGKSPGQLRG